MDELNGNNIQVTEVTATASRIPTRRKNGRLPSAIPRLLRPAEVAEILQIHQSSVYRLARRGVITSVVLPPKTLRFRQSDIEAFIGRCATKPRRQAMA